MFGPKMKSPTGVPAERRGPGAAGARVDAGAVWRVQPPALRHPSEALAIRPADLQIAGEPEGLRFDFTLPSGVYATTLFSEFPQRSRRGCSEFRDETSESEAAEDLNKG